MLQEGASTVMPIVWVNGTDPPLHTTMSEWGPTVVMTGMVAVMVIWAVTRYLLWGGGSLVPGTVPEPTTCVGPTVSRYTVTVSGISQ